MTLLLRAAGVTMLGIAVVACGSDESDEAAIENTFRDFLNAMVNVDVIALENLLSADCDDARSRAARAIGEFQDQLTGDVEFNVTGVVLRDLTVTTVEAMPVGTYRFDDDEGSLGSEGGEFSALVREDGEWKFADCNILFGS